MTNTHEFKHLPFSQAFEQGNFKVQISSNELIKVSHENNHVRIELAELKRSMRPYIQMETGNIKIGGGIISPKEEDGYVEICFKELQIYISVTEIGENRIKKAS